MRTVLTVWLTTSLVCAQNGDRPGEVQPPLPEELSVPSAPALSPLDELATMVVEEGYRVELVAAEPLVNDPVAAEFDEHGRLWVVEMTGYMPDVDGHDEDAPVGMIAVLNDTDGDGRMDSRSTFMDHLVLPRSVHPARGGALVILPGQVLFCRDEDGDGYASEQERTLIDTFQGGITSPEHALNGFEYTLDDAFRCADGNVRYAWRDGHWIVQRTTGGGQWGITKDDEGRIFFNTNSDPLRGDLFPSRYGLRNPNHGRIWGLNVRIAQSFATWPSRMNPGVNRGYQPGLLREDYTLSRVTAVCGPHIYRGDASAALRGSAFVPEPAGNLVKRYRFTEEGLGLRAEPAYEGREFLTSTDERFRPVNAFGGPDGALYFVDMYRGILQHRMFVTSFLRRQILERGLEEPLGLGRIWRVVPLDFSRPAPLDMRDWTFGRLIGALDSPNGWLRDTAQRVLIEDWDGDPWVLDRLVDLAREGEQPLGRLHALWTLNGLGYLPRQLLLDALADGDGRVVRAAMQLAEPYLATGREEAIRAVQAAGLSGDPRSLHQALCSLGAVRTPDGDRALADILTRDCSSPGLRSAALSGLYQREEAFLESLLDRSTWELPAEGRDILLQLLARATVRNGKGREIERLLEVALGNGQAWRSEALLRGLLAGRDLGPTGKPAPIRLARRPAGIERLQRLVAEGELAREVDQALIWPGKQGVPPEAVIRPLDDDEQEAFERGREIYAAVCTGCHQGSGRGEGGKAPRLRGSPWVLGSQQRLVRILSQGLVGPLEIDGEVWDLEMPALSGSDQELADVLTYVRREWGHGADPVTAETVHSVRAREHDRPGPWTVRELLEIGD